ncbi:prepilin-type N-terminal cleavage/methylation domain-containing protein [Acidobacteria bacterium ACD]|nr:MAG: prepilin-type N-terminal cleavage/methylation domain-containing protein [Acidobacteriota bacterium]MCE7959977.1 prepilin-type N-terminal cleavage/methylation domain-containing protein [Acidobacteria bacterium ACB2]MDL1951110.1 prepilin-type N-terminal cleavage/methylation domain-containing protein [Acidobacteria bacterium ACD]
MRLPPRRRARGYTLLELLVVMAVLGILAAVAVPQLLKTPIRAREAALKENLFTFRSMIDQYYADKGNYPDSLETLVTDGYIRKVPVDPFTKSSETWQLTYAEADDEEGAEEAAPGIVDVHSGSTETALDGTAYSSW